MKEKLRCAKDTAWGWCSKYCRLRDADKNGIVTCCTCGVKVRWDSAECHAGHFVGGRGNNVLFDDTLIHGQCWKCNDKRIGAGEQGKYVLFMKKKYGFNDLEIEVILNSKFTVKKYSISEVREIGKSYRLEFKELLKKRGF